MGMFDYIHYGDHRYQTKSLNNTLDEYKIENGLLWKEVYDFEWVDDESSRFGGYMKKNNKKWVTQTTTSCEIEFYRNTDSTYKTWEEYTAFIIDGYLVKIINTSKESA